MRNILIILKSEDLRLALRDALQPDYNVTICGDARAGAELLRQRPDAMVLDLFLSGPNGFAFLENNRGLLPPATLMLTTMISDEIIQAASDLGVCYMIRKPCAISTVVNRLTEYMK